MRAPFGCRQVVLNPDIFILQNQEGQSCEVMIKMYFTYVALIKWIVNKQVSGLVADFQKPSGEKKSNLFFFSGVAYFTFLIPHIYNVTL